MGIWFSKFITESTDDISQSQEAFVDVNTCERKYRLTEKSYLEKKEKDSFLCWLLSTKTQRKRIPQVWRIPQFKIKNNYQNIAWKIGQYRKHQCPPSS